MTYPLSRDDSAVWLRTPERLESTSSTLTHLPTSLLTWAMKSGSRPSGSVTTACQ